MVNTSAYVTVPSPAYQVFGNPMDVPNRWCAGGWSHGGFPAVDLNVAIPSLAPCRPWTARSHRGDDAGVQTVRAGTSVDYRIYPDRDHSAVMANDSALIP